MELEVLGGASIRGARCLVPVKPVVSRTLTKATNPYRSAVAFSVMMLRHGIVLACIILLAFVEGRRLFSSSDALRGIGLLTAADEKATTQELVCFLQTTGLG